MCIRAGWEKSAKRGWPRAPASDSSAWRRMGSVLSAPGRHTTAARASTAAIVAYAAVGVPLARSTPTKAAALNTHIHTQAPQANL